MSGERPRNRERKVLKTESKSAANRWGHERERHLLVHGPPQNTKEVPTLREFAPRFINEYAIANRQKPSGISNKQSVLNTHLLPALGSRQLRPDHDLRRRATEVPAPGQVTEDGEQHPDRPQQAPEGDEYARLIAAAAQIDTATLVVVLLGGDGGLRAGEMRALEWTDLDFVKRQIRVERSHWRGQVGSTKGNRVR
jgi:integrase